MTQSKRILFSFEERDYERLGRMKTEGKFGSLAATVRAALLIGRTLQKQTRDGFTETIVRNPATGVERIVVLPELVSEGKNDDS